MQAMTKEQILNLEKNGARMPVRFTGKWKGDLFYMGLPWKGPTNLMGAGLIKLVDLGPGNSYFAPDTEEDRNLRMRQLRAEQAAARQREIDFRRGRKVSGGK